MPDGRMCSHARPNSRVAAAIVVALTTLGIGLVTASPASARPRTSDLEVAQARVERLSQQAEVASKRHDKAHGTLGGSRTQLNSIVAEIEHQRRVLDTLRTQMATAVVREYADGYPSSTGSWGAAAGLSQDSKLLLTNLTLVSENTGARGDAMVSSNSQLQHLDQSRAAVRDQITVLAGREKTLHGQDRKVGARFASASSRLDRLEEEVAAERVARLGGPVVAYAKAQVGKAYVWGAAGPSSFDCSGLTMMAWQQAGVSLPHNSAAQYATGRRVARSELQPGDLVFYYSPISHVGLYIGGGQIVSALNPGAGIKVRGVDDMPYVGAVRPG